MSRNQFVLIAAAVISVSCGDSSDGTLVLVNDSDFVIEEVRVAAIDEPLFSVDLTGLDVLFPGESLIVDLDCDFYDVLFMDELGVECTVFDVDVCFNGTRFVITDTLLDTCAFAPAK